MRERLAFSFRLGHKCRSAKRLPTFFPEVGHDRREKLHQNFSGLPKCRFYIIANSAFLNLAILPGRVRKVAHGALAKRADADLGRLRFNRCVAQIYELTNELSGLLASIEESAVGDDVKSAFREAGKILVQLFAPIMPHLGKECSERCPSTLVAEAMADGRSFSHRRQCGKPSCADKWGKAYGYCRRARRKRGRN